MSAAPTRRGILSAMAVAPAVAAGAIPYASRATEWKRAGTGYRSAHAALLDHEYNVYDPAYLTWKASGEPMGGTMEAIYDRNTALEEGCHVALERAIDATVSSLTELREKIDLIDEADGFGLPEWGEKIARDIRRLVAREGC